jgi:hypothetical protein
MDSKGEEPRKVSHTSVRKDLVHTKDMKKGHASSAGYMRRVALKIDGILHVVWGQQSGSLARTRPLTYAGEGKLKAIWDDDLCDNHQWLTAGEYDSETRAALDELWEEAGTHKYWFMLGASAMERGRDRTGTTIMSCVGENWEMQAMDGLHSSGLIQDTLPRMLGMIDRIELPGLEGERDRRTVEQSLGRVTSSMRRQQMMCSRQARMLRRGTEPRAVPRQRA